MLGAVRPAGVVRPAAGGMIEGNVVVGLEQGAGYLNSAALRVFTMHTLDDQPALRARVDERSDRQTRRGRDPAADPCPAAAEGRPPRP